MQLVLFNPQSYVAIAIIFKARTLKLINPQIMTLRQYFRTWWGVFWSYDKAVPDLKI